MRILALVLALCFSFNVLATSGTAQELDRLMDDYSYDMNVAWDQQDQNYYNTKTQEFFVGLQKLIVENGLTKATLLEMISKKVNNPQLVDAISLKFALLPENLSVSDIADIMKETAKDFSARGASWNGQVILPSVIILTVAGVIGYSLYWSATHKCVAYQNQYVCNTYNNCGYGGGYYGGSYCYGTYTSCGYQSVCTDYVKQ